jgi:lambda family phage minor tail protein L
MTNLIATDAQTQEIDSGLIDLFEITLPNGTVLRFHPGVDDDLTNIYFRESTSPYTEREYIPFPIIIDGLDLQADGASSRPSLTIANLGGLFAEQLGDFNNDDLVDCKIIRRQTLKKYLYGESGDATPPIEFRKQEYIIDRIASESNIALVLEVAMPFDLENIKLPRRVVVGKYCSWKYQQDGCSWAADSAVQYGDYTHNPYFNIDDSPLLDALPSGSIAHSSSTAYTTSSYVTHNSKNWQCLIAHTNQTPSSTSSYWKEVFLWDDWVTSTSYAKGDRVRHGATGEKTIWKCIQAHTSSAAIVPPAPATDTLRYKSSYWEREDLCGKTMQSCKCRFGFIPVADSANNEAPKSDKNTAATLPFGSFPGTLKF